MPEYTVNRRAVRRAKELIDAGRYVVNSDWGEVQPEAADSNRFLKNHTWADYSAWHLGLTLAAGHAGRWITPRIRHGLAIGGRLLVLAIAVHLALGA